MKDHVKILYRGAQAEITEKRSRFIATTHPVRTQEEAEAFVGEMRKKYYDARHNAYAWVIGENALTARQSDDGEPSQTAGVPILDVLQQNKITDACIVVTRYFGGTLLGTGGLFRAYGKAAEEGLAASVVVEKRAAERWMIRMGYSDFGKIRNAAEIAGLYLNDIIYADDVGIDLIVPVSKKGEAESLINEMTGARSQISRLETVPFAVYDGKVILFEEESLAIPKD